MHSTNDKNSSWESFWKDNPTGFNSTMQQSTLYFAESLAIAYPILAEDRFLDIGCGPGFLIDYLKDKCELVCGTDISKKYIEICKEKYANCDNVLVSTSEVNDYKTYQELIIGNRINRVVLLSILQYYHDVQNVKDLILSLKAIAKQQSFSCLLADIIPTKHSIFDDIFSIIRHAFKKGYTLKFVKFLSYAMFSNYSKVKKNGMLQIDEVFFKSLAEELGLEIEIVKGLTLHTGRYSVLINFK